LVKKAVEHHCHTGGRDKYACGKADLARMTDVYHLGSAYRLLLAITRRDEEILAVRAINSGLECGH
jgi:hypothetical protein